jgi:hypothetical protein
MTSRDIRSLAPPSRQKFMRHLGEQAGYAGILVVGSIMLGMAGYHWVVGRPWDDAFENTAMLLGGMGPVGPDITNRAGKIFAGVFALYAGLVFLVVTALVLTPVFHYVLHRFHWENMRSE